MLELLSGRVSSGMRGFRHARGGNVAILFALSLIPLLFAAVFALDYGTAARIKTQLQAAADSAILAGTTPAMMSQSYATATAAVIRQFKGQASLIKGFTYSGLPTITGQDQPNGSSSTVRTIKLVYNATIPNSFGKLYGVTNTTFSVTSAESATTAPNIDFYLLLDNSPSMELPATQAGIDKMNSFGCALACHETDLTDGEYSTPYPGWGSQDSYTYAENNGITLRIDNVRNAASSLATTARDTMAGNNATYRLAAYAFNYGVTTLQSLITTTSANVTTFQAGVNSMTPPLMDSNSNLAGNQSYTYPVSSTSYQTVMLGSSPLYNNDAMTDIGMAMTKLNAIMPTPGNGTNATGDKPKEVLMIVTDGVNDANLLSGSSCSTSYNWGYSNSYGSFFRCQSPINTTMCTTIKNRNILIAVLYTTYFPVPSNSWYQSTVAPFISQVPTNLQNCASNASLYYEVQTGGDITAAMKTLFANAVYSASHLTQ